MKVIDPDRTNNTLYIIPRYYNIDNTHTFLVKDEDTLDEVEETSVVSFPLDAPIRILSIANGYIEYDIRDIVFPNLKENKTYVIKITDATTSNIVWRGKFFATSQTSQEYKING